MRANEESSADRSSPDKRESGMPGGGAGRKDFPGKTGVYRVSGPLPEGDAPIIGMASWGQGSRGAAGYEDHGESELFFTPVTPEKCRDVMTKNPVCCLGVDPVTRVARLMKEHDIGVLPVVENPENGHLAGVVTDRDLALRVLAESLDPETTNASAIMSKPAIACSPDAPYEDALKLMEARKVRRVMVTDDSGRVVGVIAQSDVGLRIRDAAKTAEVVESIFQPDPARA